MRFYVTFMWMKTYTLSYKPFICILYLVFALSISAQGVATKKSIPDKSKEASKESDKDVSDKSFFEIFKSKKQLADKLFRELQKDNLDFDKDKSRTKKSARKISKAEKKVKKGPVPTTTDKEIVHTESAQKAHIKCTVELEIEGVIGPVTLDMVDKAIAKVRKENCSSLLLLVNTPGGQLFTTRKIVDRILNTEFPVLCLIYPAGAHAGSAGAIIMQACHVNGGLETTNIGAATPIMGTGDDISEDLRKKLINDTTSWLDSLTDLRKRSKKFGREIVTEAKALSAKEAFKQNAIDFVGQTKTDFLHFAQNRAVTVVNGEAHRVQVGDLKPLFLGFRYHVISLITAPEFVYILFTGSLFLLYFEITHPGLGAPGILGVLGLIISFVGMNKLAFSWAGLILILMSVGLFLAEVFITGFGIFGFAGIISFMLGSVLLFDPAQTGGVDIPFSLILSISLVFFLLMSGVTYLALRTVRMKRKNTISDDFLDENNPPGTVLNVNEEGTSGTLLINGENWQFESKEPLKVNDKVKVLCYKGLVLTVQPIIKEKRDA